MTYSTILVNLEAGRPNTRLLQVAREIAERFQAGVIGTTACAQLQLVYGDGYAYGDVLDQDTKEIEDETRRAEAEFRDAIGRQAGFLEWSSAALMTSLSEHLASEASRADLILTNTVPPDTFNAARQVDLGELVMQAGRPVLLVAPGATPFRMNSVVVGWKDTPEARRAVADALPLLKTASSVGLVEVAAKNDLIAARSRLNSVAAWLGRHGIAADVHAILADGDDADWLDAMAAERNADIVVAGAYGHSRVREWALGGVTRSLLKQSARSCLVSH